MMHQVDYAETMAMAKPYIEAILVVGGVLLFLLIALSLLQKWKGSRSSGPQNLEGWYRKVATGLEQLAIQTTASFDMAAGLIGLGKMLGDASIARAGKMQKMKLCLDVGILGVFYMFTLPVIILVALYPFEFPGQPQLWFLVTATGLFLPLLVVFVTGIVRACVSLVSWLCLRKGIAAPSKKHVGKSGSGRLWMLPSVDAIGIAVLVAASIVLFHVVKFSMDNAFVDLSQYTILLTQMIFSLLWLGLIMAAILVPMGILQLAGSKGLAKAFNELGSAGNNEDLSIKS
jgi:hypothetical protein